jgi:hypothetical protein
VLFGTSVGVSVGVGVLMSVGVEVQVGGRVGIASTSVRVLLSSRLSCTSSSASTVTGVALPPAWPANQMEVVEPGARPATR